MSSFSSAGATYEPTDFSIEKEWSEPSYKQFLDWAANTDSKALALDIWARGNYIHYLMNRNKSEVPSVVIPFTYLDELRVYYRRMALMDIPAHYVYVGEIGTHQKHLCLVPGDDDFIHDGGAGWSVVMSEPLRLRRRKWLFALGSSRLMPEVFVEWLTTEASADFARGHAFLSPAELIGIPKSFVDEGIEMTADFSNATPFFSHVASTELMFNLELPYIDDMDHDTFIKIIQDNDLRLARFRFAIRKLVKGTQPNNVSDTLDELKDEIAQMRLSDSGLQLRQTISRFGGLFTTVAASASAFGASIGKGLSTLETVGATVAGAVTAGAVAAFVDIWKQNTERRAKRRENKYSIFWDLGVKKPCDLKRHRNISKIKMLKQSEPVLLTENRDCHWLCESGPNSHFIFQVAKKQ
ncbi:MAG TPA: hypothetical protein VIE65_18810 [Methylobacter sp.]